MLKDSTVEQNAIEHFTSETASRSALDELRQWLKTATARAHEVDNRELTSRAERHFDAGFFERFGREQFPSFVYKFIEQELRPSRVRIRLDALSIREAWGDASKRLDQVEATRIRSVFEGWMEPVERGRKVSMLSMTRRDVDMVIARYGVEATRVAQNLEWFREVRVRLKNKTQRIGDAWKPEEIARLYAKIFPKKEKS